jgi:hypothetical protein
LDGFALMCDMVYVTHLLVFHSSRHLLKSAWNPSDVGT